MNFLLNIDNYKDKTSRELFENEKKLRPIFLAMIISLVIVFGLFTSVAIITTINWLDPIYFQNKIDFWLTNITNATSQQANYAIENQRIAEIFVSFLYVIFSGGALTSYVVSILKSYKQKNFSKISPFPSMFIGLISINFVVSIIMNLSSVFRSIMFHEVQNILNLVTSVLCIFIWFFISRNISLIRKISINSEIREKLNSMVNNEFNSNYSGFKKQETSFYSNSKNNDAKNENIDEKQQETLNPFSNLNDEQVDQIASKLSISGYEEMTRKEKEKRILDLTMKKNKNEKTPTKEEKPIVIEPEIEE